MPLKHLYIHAPLTAAGALTAPKPLQHRMAHVLRLGVGDEVALFNGTDGLWQATIADKTCKTLKIDQQLKPQTQPSPFTLVLGLPKREAWEAALRQATELGVGAIQPLTTQYAQRGQFNTERAQILLIEAAEQSEQLALPSLLPLHNLESWLKTLKVPCLWGHARGEQGQKASATMVLVGPEGGFSPAEEALLAAHPHVVPTHLPTGILRTDTAVVALLSAALIG
jgi:16S rRNA (uracil1498-N3)-methyltransferase